MDLPDILPGIILKLDDDTLFVLVKAALAEMNLRYWLRSHPELVR